MNNKKIQRCFEWAREASEQSNFYQHHLGAVAVYKGCLLAKGFNSYTTSPIQKKYNRQRDFDVEKYRNSLHAEIHCLSKIDRLDIDFSKVDLFIYRQYKNGKPAIAMPCPACRKMIHDMGIKHIYYTTDYGWAMEEMNID